MAAGLHVAAITTTESATATAGVGLVLGSWRQALSDRGHRVELITASETPPPGPLAAAAAARLRAACVAFSGELVRRWTAERPDLVHVELAGNVGLAALDAAQQLQLPTSSVFHHLHLYAAPGTEQRVASLLARFHRRCGITVAEQASSAERLRSMGVPDVAIIGRGVDADAAAGFHPRWRDGQLRTTWGAAVDDPVLLFVGRLIPTKDPLGFAAACQRARERHAAVRAVVVGAGPEQAALREALPWATYTGQLSGEALRRAYASADIFVLSSPAEPWGNVVLEAAASGLAVVGRSGGAINDILMPRQACALPLPRNQATCAETVAALAVDPARRRDLAVRARSAAETQSWASVAAAWEDVWRGLLAAQR